MKELLNAIDQHGSFVFWTCPKGCNGIVVWNENKTQATCQKCGAKSQENVVAKLTTGQKQVLKLIAKDQGDDGWTPVSNVLYPHLSQNLPRELVVFDGDEGNYRAKLTDEGTSIVRAMKWL